MNNKNTGIRSSYSKKKKGKYFQIDNVYVALYAKHLGVVATAVFISLNMHADKKGKCWPSMVLIGDEYGIDRHTVSDAIKKLEEWNMIHVDRIYNRKLKKYKNNTYWLLPKELWRKPPVENEEDDACLGGYCDENDIVVDEDNFWAWNDVEEDGNENTTNNDSEKSHGTKSATHMASKIPNDGTEDTSNNNHITKTIKENSICGEPTEIPFSLSNKLQLLENGKSEKAKLGVSKSAVWNSDQAILSLVKNDSEDLQIIGEYFFVQKLSFNNKSAFEAKLKRSLRAAKSLMEYEIDDIRKTMKWLNDADFDYDGMDKTDIIWSLEAVKRYIDDCIKTNFIPNGTSRIELLSKLNTIKIPIEPTAQPETAAFMTFWNAYPKKMDRLSAEKVFKTIDPKLYPKIMESIEQQKKTEQWYKIEYVPQASKWLENKRWEDEVVPSSVDPIERYARELIKQFPPDNDTTAQFRFSKKYGNQNLLKFKNLFQL